MKLTDEQIQMAASILHKVVTDPKIKLQYGHMKRAEIKEQLRKGQKIVGYRVEWLRVTRDEIVKVLDKAAKDFNSEHKHDRISVNDMNDALTTTQYALQLAAEKKLKGED